MVQPTPNNFRISPQQQRLWQLQNGHWQSTYQALGVVEIVGDIDIDLLELSIKNVAERHEILRTTLRCFPGIDWPLQVIENSRVRLQYADLKPNNAQDWDEKFNTDVQAFTSQKLDFEQDSPLQTRLLRKSFREHILLVSLPALYADRVAVEKFVQEVGAEYRRQRQDGDRPEDPWQYADLSEWLHELLESEDTESGREYWHKLAVPSLNPGRLAFEQGSLPSEQFTTNAVTLTLRADTIEQIDSLLDKYKTTCSVFLLTCWEVLLWRLTGQSDLVIGVAYDGRKYEELQDAIGLLTKYLPLCSTLDENVQFSEHLVAVNQVVGDFYKWQEYFKWEQVFPIEADRSTLLSYPYCFDFAEPALPINVDDVIFSIQQSDSCIERSKVRLSCIQTSGSLVLKFHYDTSLYQEEAIKILASQYQAFIESVVRHPESCIRNVVFLGQAERQRLLRDLNNTQTDYPRDRCVHQLFEAQVQLTPNNIAAAFGNQFLTYQELNAKANQLAHYLQTQGVQPEILVAICLERSLNLVVGILGILKAGAAYVPLDPVYPQQRLADMLEDSQTLLLLTQHSLAPTFSEFGGELLCLDKDWESAIAPFSTNNLPSKVRPENLAYTIYTSGSTGKPKGVMIAHCNLVNYLSWCMQAYPIDRGCGSPVHSSISFDATLTSFFTPLLCGKKVVLLPERQEIEALKEILCAEQDFSLVKITPAHLDLLNQLLPEDEIAAQTHSFVIGGEALLGKSLRSWRQYAPTTQIVNEYGPSETVVGCCIYEVSDQTDLTGVVPIGRPIANTQIYILDETLNLVPTGISGEIYIGGAGVGRGYRNRPDLTADKFIPDPFSEIPGARLYRSGDLGRYLPSGDLEFLGRIDHQVKIRSFRIELGEIESVLSQHPAIQEGIVTVREEENDRYLVAYVVPKAESTNLLGQIDEWTHQHISRWQTIYKETYGQSPTHSDLTFNIAGWNSSYTNSLLSDLEMQEWVERTVDRIRSLHPKKVLEIGCGTGLLLSRIAPECMRYDGADFSPEAIRYLQSLKDTKPELAHINLLRRTADDFNGFKPSSFDTVIINSVIQYFPNIYYLVKVIQQAVEVVQPGGNIFIGDVRSLPLLEAYHASVELEQASNDLSREQLQQRVRRRLLEEEELVIDPDFFLALQQHLPQIGAVQIQLKQGRFNNELTRFRYDVVLQVGTQLRSPVPVQWLDWSALQIIPEQVYEQLVQQQPESLGIRGVANARIQADLELIDWLTNAPAEAIVGDRDRKAAIHYQGVDPDLWWECVRDLPYAVTVTWSATKLGCYDVLFCYQKANKTNIFLETIATVTHGKPWEFYANNPLQNKLTQYLAPQLRQFVKDRLPDYMIPRTFILLSSLPLTSNGKVDRRALPVPTLSRDRAATTYIAPQTDSEELLANLWAEILGIEQVGLEDNFFELGGHSLLATQLISRIRDIFAVELPVRSLFEAPTIASLHQKIDLARNQNTDFSISPIQSAEYSSEVPLSFPQQRLWFLSQIEGANATYNMPAAVRIEGNLNVEALKQSLREVVQRHGTLRTKFQLVNGTPMQVLAEYMEPSITIIDLQNVPATAQATEVEQWIVQEAQRPFDLENGPLFRAKLLCLHPNEHIFLLTMHHIISDGWSIGVLIREMTALYKTFSQQSHSPLSPLPIQYIDFTQWQRQLLQGEVLERLLSYWQQQLAGIPALLNLPTDYPRPPIQTFRGDRIRFQLSPELTRRLRELSQQRQTTLFMTLLAAFSALLFRYSEQEDIAIGSPIANRTRSETEPLIGFFVNTLVLRTQPSGEMAFLELLEETKAVCLDAYAYQDIPFERLVEALKPERSLSHNPLFQVMFALQNAPVLDDLGLSNLTLTPLQSENVTAMFDLSLLLEETKSQIVGSWEYSRDLFESDTIERMVGHFQMLLEAIVIDPHQRLAELPMLTEVERQQLFVGWNNTRSDYLETQLIHQLFEAQVERTPDAIALSFEETQISYGELNRRSNQLARYLQTLGVGSESLVGICMERSPELVIGLLAILKSGAAYVPIDPNYPQERQTSILNDAQLKVVLKSLSQISKIPKSGIQAVDVARSQTEIESLASTNLTQPLTNNHLAYVLYTSGSTGLPKGVAIEHRSVVAFLHWAQTIFPPSQLDGVLASTSICFDLSIFELFLPLICGGKVILVENVLQLTKLAATKTVTLVNTVPSAITELLNINGIPDSVRTINLAGEPLSAQLVQRLYQKDSIAQVYNLYGPSEDTTYSTMALIPRDCVRSPSIGKAISNTQAYVLDRFLQPVPVGVPGELYLGGAGLARGYLNRPELTAESFIPNSFSNIPGERLYKTGDLVRYRANGELEYLGRRDYLVKIRGFRIELGEIEAVLRQNSQVRETVVVVSSDNPSGEKQIVAYVVPQSPTSSLIHKLRDFLQERLPSYMIPANFILLETFPLTPNGKIDRKALPKPSLNHAARTDKNYVPPRSLLELQLVRLWESVLGLEPVSVLDNFFEIGGHSLLAVRLMAAIQQHFGYELPLSTLFVAPTIVQLAQLLSARTETSIESAIVQIQSIGSNPPFFCVPGVGGNILYFYDLARHLGQDQPFYGFQAQGLDGKLEPHSSIEEMARSYIEALRQVQPEGPYSLGGHSFGGWVAFEMAQQLQLHGQEVALLAIFDAVAPGVDDSILGQDWDDTQWLLQMAQLLEDSYGKELEVSYDDLQNRDLETQITYVTQRLKEADLLPAGAGAEQIQRLLRVFKANSQMRYLPQILYETQIHLFRVDENQLEKGDGDRAIESRQNPTLGWEKLADIPVVVHNVPGTHTSMMASPHVQVLAKSLQFVLKQSQMSFTDVGRMT
jgi:amino acid adenylation domain-containing protein